MSQLMKHEEKSTGEVRFTTGTQTLGPAPKSFMAVWEGGIMEKHGLDSSQEELGVAQVFGKVI
jgi:hypothetical protein